MGRVALVIVTILAIALYSDRANRAGVVLLSDDLLASVQRRITTQVTSYLDPAVRATRLVRDAVEWSGFSIVRQRSRRSRLARFAKFRRSTPSTPEMRKATSSCSAAATPAARSRSDQQFSGPRCRVHNAATPRDELRVAIKIVNDDLYPRMRNWYPGALAPMMFFLPDHIYSSPVASRKSPRPFATRKAARECSAWTSRLGRCRTFSPR